MQPRLDSPVRCAYCHASAGADASACAGCRAVVLRRCSGDLTGALADAGEAVKRAADDEPWPHEVRGRLRLLTGDPEGVEDLDTAVERGGARACWPSFVRGVARAARDDREGAVRDLRTAAGRALHLSGPRLWLAALGDESVHLERLTGFDANVARCLRGETSGRALLEMARSWPWGERSARRCLRRAHALLGFAAHSRGDSTLAAEHVQALLALSDDGSLERDWAVARARLSSRTA